jgi:uncharacterized protein
VKILVVSDHEEKLLYDFFDPDLWVGKVDLVISCGDLRPEYLSYLVTVLRVPLLYVAGNHDGRYQRSPPEGCDDIDGKLVRVGGLRIAGLEGCYRYSSEADHPQFTTFGIRRRLRRLDLSVWRAGGLDIMVTHAAPLRCPFTPHLCPKPAGLGLPCIHPEIPGHPEICPEATDPCHRGVGPYNDALLRWKPRFWLHGHNHIEYGRVPRLWWIGRTQVINGDGHVVLDLGIEPDPERGSMVSRP